VTSTPTYSQAMPSEPFQARDVAAAIRRRLPSVGAKKLHKLLYYAQAHHLAAFGQQLFVQSISAWDMGPVVGAFWHEEQTPDDARDAAALDEAGLSTVGYVVSRYGRLTGRDLEVLSRGELPWQDADRRRKLAGERSARISPATMVEYFSADADDSETALDPTELDAMFAGAAQQSRHSRGDADDLDLDQLRQRLLDWQQSA
jgi:uncharacterized phage-associated protein